MRAVRTALALLATLPGIILIIPVAILAFPFWLVASLTRFIVRLIEPSFVAWNQVIAFDPTVGWKPKPNLDAYGLADEVFHFTTDSQGWRGKTSLSESEIVVFGDSFAFGYGVDDRALFSEINPALRIKPIGSPGYSMVHGLILMRQIVSQLRGKLVVWFIYLGNDLYENLLPDVQGYRSPFVRRINGIGNWELVTQHITPAKWTYSSNRRLYLDVMAKLCSPGYLSDRVYDACEFLIKEGNDVCNQAGAHLAVMTIPDSTQLSQSGLQFLASRIPDATQFNPDFPDQRIGQICAKLGIAFLAAKQHLSVRDYKVGDVHWNERGNREVGKLLSRLYHDYSVGPIEQASTANRSKSSADLEESGTPVVFTPNF